MKPKTLKEICMEFCKEFFVYPNNYEVTILHAMKYAVKNYKPKRKVKDETKNT